MTDGIDEGSRQARQRITDWLLAEGWKLKDITGKARGAAWALEGADPRGKVLVFAQAVEKPDALFIQASITVDETSQARLAKLGRERNEELGWEIRFQLLSMGVKFAGLDLPLKRFGLVSRVYTDDLGRNDFFDRVDRLQDGITAAIWLIRRALAQPAPESEAADGLEVN